MEQSTTTEHTCTACGGKNFTVAIYRSEHLGSHLMMFCANHEAKCSERFSPTWSKDMIQTD